MQFEVIPILDRMVALYEQPRSPARFQAYLKMLQGDTKGDMVLPIGGYNPMAKPHVLEQLQTLQSLGAEEIAQTIALKWNQAHKKEEQPIYQICLNLADDAQGGWTNRYTTDFDSKFKLNPLVSRGFCTPYFWTTESYTEAEIENRIGAQVYRTVYWHHHPKPKTLADHLEQEIYVQQKLHGPLPTYDKDSLAQIEEIYEAFAHEDDYNLIFNFFYGDEAAASLSFSTGGIKQITGYDYAQIVANRR